MSDYQAFLRAKMAMAPELGIVVPAEDVHATLKPHQADIVRWALAGGRRAIFAAFGLGKSIMQLEVMRLLLTGGHAERALIICPLGVRQEFVRDARDLLGIDATFVRWTADVDRPGLYLTNYESVRDGRLDPNLFDAVSLDEASVLRSFGSKTYQTFLALFEAVRYRFVATATPSPNRYKELIHYAGFLGVMDTGQALTPGDLVYDPFMGIGTVALQAIKAGRRARGSELNTSYWLDSVKYLEAHDREHEMPSLFDLEAS